MLRGGGIPLTEKDSRFVGVLVSWFLVCFCLLVSWFLTFFVLVSKFLGFRCFCFFASKLLSSKVSKFQKTLVLYYHMSMSCFLEDTGPISKVFKNLLDGSSGFPGARLFRFVRKSRNQNLKCSHIIFFEMIQGCS